MCVLIRSTPIIPQPRALIERLLQTITMTVLSVTNVKTCKKTDPDIEACMKDLAEVIKPHLRNIVVPNVGALEPLAVRDMKVLGNQPNSMLSFTKSNVQLHNLDDFQLNSYK